MSIVVMVDSGANINKAMLKKYNLTILPYNIMFANGDCYRDVLDVKNKKELRSLIENHNDIPRIDQVSEDEIENCFRKYIDNGDDILYISVSSKLSLAYQEVVNVSKKFDPRTIEIIDSLNVGSGETLLALYAIDYVNKGHGLKQVARYLNEIKYFIKSCYVISDPTYLYSQNRGIEFYDKFPQFYKHIPVAEIRNGKIVLTFNAKESELALQVLKNTITDYNKDIDNSHMIISYSNDRSNTHKLKEVSTKLVRDINVEIIENSSVVFTSTGNDSLSVAFLLDKEKVL